MKLIDPRRRSRPILTVTKEIVSFGQLAPEVVSTRASANGSLYNPQGLLEIADTDVARFTHDPATLVALGLLIEEARENLFTYSEQFDHANWAKTSSSFSANATTAPDGNATADKFLPSLGTVSSFVVQDFAVTNTEDYTQTIFGKDEEYAFLQITGSAGFDSTNRINIDLSDGSLGATAGSGITVDVKDVGNGWYLTRVTLTATATGSGGRMAISPLGADLDARLPAQTNNGTDGLYNWGAQVEKASFPTSYIPTTAAAATRAKDGNTMPLGDWFNGLGGALIIAFNADYADSGRVLFELSDGTTANYLQVKEHTDGKLRIETNIASAGATGTSSTIAFIAGSKLAITYDTDEVRFSVDGEDELTHAASGLAVGSFDQKDLGQNSAAANQLNGTMLYDIYYDQVLGDTKAYSA